MARDEDRPGLTLVRRIKAPPSLVYAAWTRPDMLVRWFGPDAGPVLSAEADVRVGGSYRIRFATEDGEEHVVLGDYLEVVHDAKLVFTWQWITMPERRSRATVLIRPVDAGSELTLIHEQFRDEAARDGHRAGWSGAFDKLRTLLEPEQGEGR